MNTLMRNPFKKPTELQLLKSQLEEAQRCRAIYRAEAELMSANADMFDQRVVRLTQEIDALNCWGPAAGERYLRIVEEAKEQHA